MGNGDRVLVIGATGKTGRTLVRILVERGVPVRAASCHPGASEAGVEAVEFDWSRPETHDAVLAGVGRIYLVAPALVVDPSGQIGPFVEKAANAGTRGIVHLSAMGVDGTGEEAGLRKAELAVMSGGMDWTILRPNWFMQNFSESFFLPPILERSEVLAPAGKAAVSFTDTRDISAVAAKVLTEEGHAGKEYTLTGGQALTFAEVADAVGDASGRAIRYSEVSPERMRRVMVESGIPEDYAGGLLGLFEVVRAGWSASVSGDVEQILGSSPTSFADYARDNADAWRRAA